MEFLVTKRDGTLVDFDSSKIKSAITKTNSRTKEMAAEDIERIVKVVENKCLHLKDKDKISVEQIQDLVEDSLLKSKFNQTAKSYILYRDQRTRVRNGKTKMMQEILEMTSGKSDYWNKENSNKDAQVVTTQRDYLAGIVSTEISKTLLLPPEISKAHEAGIIHFHDLDYFCQNSLHNCDLINLEDMLQNGTMINGVMIEKPHKLLTAMTIATQIITAVASSQYGGCTITLTHLEKYKERNISDADCEKFAKVDLNDEIKAAVQTFNYQINSMSTTNGQAPFLSVNMYLNETDDYKEELALLIEEFLKQRIQGMKNEKGIWITPAFQK